MGEHVAIYCRLSRNRGDERSASTQRQEAACRALCDSRGWSVAMVEIDDDTSAYSGKRRPGYDRALDAIRTGTISAIVAWHPDRLHRSPAELETFIDVIEGAGAEVATVQTGQLDLAAASGRLQARMLGSLARYESEHRSARTRSAHEAIAAQGRWSGGKRTYGYSTDPTAPGGIVVVPAEATQIRAWVRQLLDGATVGQLVTEANEANVPTVNGGAWTVPTVRAIVTADRIAGRRVHRRTGTTTVGQWEPIITTDELDAVRRTLAARGGTRQPDGWRRYLLSGGLAVCGLCGAGLQAQRSGNGTPRYVCPAKSRGGCGGVSIVAEPLEDAVALMACTAAAETTPTAAPTATTTEDTDQLSGRLAELAGLFAAGDISRAEWDAARSVLAARLDAADRAAKLDPLNDWRRPGALTDAWPNLPHASRRVILDSLLTAVRVLPATKKGRTFDPDRIAPEWRI